MARKPKKEAWNYLFSRNPVKPNSYNTFSGKRFCPESVIVPGFLVADPDFVVLDGSTLVKGILVPLDPNLSAVQESDQR